MSVLKNIEAPQEKALLLVNTGTAQLHLNNPDTAFDFFERTKNLVRQFNSIEIDIYLAQGYARAHLQKNQLNDALAYAQEFLTLSEEKKGRNNIKKAHYLLYEIYKQKGLYAPALAAYESFFRIHDELSSKKNTDYVARLQAEFDSEKTAKELAILQGQNALYESNIKRQQFIRNFVILLSLSILIVGFLIFRARAISIKATLLEQKIVERTQEIQHKNLAISELLKQKETLLERKNFLFSSVSHEFRTPLTLIMGPLKQLAASTSDGNTQLTLHRIHQNATRLLRMVDQLLDLARIDMQTETIEEPIEASAVVRFLLTSMSPLFDEHKITCTTQLNTDIWIVISPEALEKIIINLLSNALKYTPQGGEVHVIGEVNDNMVTISVSDSGIGMEKDQQPRIFERFTRLENHLDKPVPGAGIGLALVKELVECYSGKIEVESEPNQGSTFTLIFPAATSTSTCTQLRLQSTACENEFAVLTQITPPNNEE